MLPITEDNTDDAVWAELQARRGKRAKRREADAQRDPGHLRVWYANQDWPDWWDNNSTDLFKQMMLAIRHSCHAACCRIVAYEKLSSRRRKRHQTKIELRKECYVTHEEEDDEQASLFR